MPEIGIAGLVVILIVALLVFGPKRLPEMGRSLGKGMREFKDTLGGKDTEPEDERPQIAAQTAAPEDETARPAPERNTVSS